jgi:His-Xaa-Ser repeat protein HxsA
LLPANAAAAGAKGLNEAPALTRAEKLRLQIMRVQVKLTTLGLYEGRIDGALNADTKAALERFQIVKGLPQSGLMTTPTLNALGVPAVN